jgi:hypothetical protein
MTTALADARRGHRGLYVLAVVMTALVPVVAALAAVDQRVLVGAPLWFKPLKFTISVALYAGTLAWMLGQLHDRVPRRAGWIVTITLAVEMAIIYGQAAVGHRSHYNVDTPWSATLWGIMGASITVLWFATLAVTLRFVREPGRDPAATTAIRLGVTVSLLGMAVGFLMAQMGAHTVGAPDGGPGLPLLGWSTTGGDLRIAHFLGMHALQGLPLLAVALAVTRRFTDETRLRLVRIAAAAWTGLVVLLTWQALRAQPLLAPDATTIAMLALLGTATVVAAAVVLAADRRAAVPAHA